MLLPGCTTVERKLLDCISAQSSSVWRITTSFPLEQKKRDVGMCSIFTTFAVIVCEIINTSILAVLINH